MQKAQRRSSRETSERTSACPRRSAKLLPDPPVTQPSCRAPSIRANDPSSASAVGSASRPRRSLLEAASHRLLASRRRARKGVPRRPFPPRPLRREARRRSPPPFRWRGRTYGKIQQRTLAGFALVGGDELRLDSSSFRTARAAVRRIEFQNLVILRSIHSKNLGSRIAPYLMTSTTPAFNSRSGSVRAGQCRSILHAAARTRRSCSCPGRD